MSDEARLLLNSMILMFLVRRKVNLEGVEEVLVEVSANRKVIRYSDKIL